MKLIDQMLARYQNRLSISDIQKLYLRKVMPKTLYEELVWNYLRDHFLSADELRELGTTLNLAPNDMAEPILENFRSDNPLRTEDELLALFSDGVLQREDNALPCSIFPNEKQTELFLKPLQEKKIPAKFFSFGFFSREQLQNWSRKGWLDGMPPRQTFYYIYGFSEQKFEELLPCKSCSYPDRFGFSTFCDACPAWKRLPQLHSDLEKEYQKKIDQKKREEELYEIQESITLTHILSSLTWKWLTPKGNGTPRHRRQKRTWTSLSAEGLESLLKKSFVEWEEPLQLLSEMADFAIRHQWATRVKKNKCRWSNAVETLLQLSPTRFRDMLLNMEKECPEKILSGGFSLRFSKVIVLLRKPFEYKRNYYCTWRFYNKYHDPSQEELNKMNSSCSDGGVQIYSQILDCLWRDDRREVLEKLKNSPNAQSSTFTQFLRLVCVLGTLYDEDIF